MSLKFIPNTLISWFKIFILLIIGLIICGGSGTSQASLPGKNGPLLMWGKQGPYDGPGPTPYLFHIFDLNLDGSATKFNVAENNTNPGLSPDRSNLAYVHQGDEIWIGSMSDLDSAKEVSRSPYESPADPVFAPDGKSFIYSNWVGNYPGIHAQELVRYWLKSGKSYSSGDFTAMWPEPDISPDGRRFAFTVGLEGNTTIRLTRKFGTMGKQFNSPVPALSPSFSPDGRELAYTSLVDGIWQVFISDLDGSNRRQLTDESTSIYKVVFSPDGTRIAYQVGSYEGTEIVVMNLRSGGTKSIGVPGNYVNLNLTEWPRVRLFRVLRFHPRRDRLRFRTFGRGTILVRSGRRLLGKRKVRRPGKHGVHIRKRTRKFTRARVVFRPMGALPGRKRIWLKR